MRDSKPDLSALVRAGRTAFRPEASDRDRVLHSLASALGAGGALEGSRPARHAASAGVRFAVRTWVLGGLGALTVGAGVFVAARSGTIASSPPAASPPAYSTSASEPAPAAIAPPIASADDRATRPLTEAPSSPAHPAVRPSSVRVASDSLPEEVRLLSKAERQLNAGHADDALRTLGEHERRFPDGALAEERLAARVQSLCALGRGADAKAELRKLARTYPESAHLDRARRFCGFDAL